MVENIYVLLILIIPLWIVCFYSGYGNALHGLWGKNYKLIAQGLFKMLFGSFLLFFILYIAVYIEF